MPEAMTMAIADDAEPAGYPAEWEFDGLLRSGEAVVVRPIRPADAPALAGLRGAHLAPARTSMCFWLARL
jgi:hypothetical protein